MEGVEEDRERQARVAAVQVAHGPTLDLEDDPGHRAPHPAAHTAADARREAFWSLHHAPEVFVLPNCWDVASALLLSDLGFPAMGTTSLGLTASIGVPDGAALGRQATVDLAAALIPRLTIPVTVDLEAGYSDDPAQVADLVVELAELGVAGVNLEDGRRREGLRAATLQSRIVSAVASAAPRVFLNARTDTYWNAGAAASEPDHRRFADTLRRLAAYRDAGAHGLFVPGLTDLQEMERITGRVGLPLNVLWQPGISLQRLTSAGVSRVSTGSALYRHSLRAALAAAAAASDGTVPEVTPIGYDDLQRRLTVSGR